MKQTTAKLVKTVRKKLKLTQAGLGEKLGKDRSTIAHYERGAITVPGDIILLLQDLLAVRERSLGLKR